MDDFLHNVEKMCEACEAGNVIGVPEPIHGGLLHHMYAVETTTGKYAIKVLNKEIISRPSAMQNYINSERIATVARNRIPALPAIQVNESFIQHLDGHFFLIYEWIEGRSLNAKNVTCEHSGKVGAILAEIHRTDFSMLGIHYERVEVEQDTHWEIYLEHGKEARADWVALLEKTMKDLYEWSAIANKAATLLAPDVVISHRDLDPKNVLWHQGEPVVIDWESAGYINPMQDLLETAIYWAKPDEGTIDKDRFFSFFEAYKERCGKQHGDWKKVLATGFSGKLGWLEYNLKRSLRQGQDQKLGTDQVFQTIMELKEYNESIPMLEQWLSED
ncbi:aminoglycoside phosphotransferase family protein [Guptibacillus algicola]|uniref:aminoglycoside phosphotransferase family protein n=1 Tax=Guptibacillus algicola TaxID=225844 RepID=UPI001CD5135C|nr:aminoglycoside phosphotransferase family protein [Alkalihalobacillus algicola]MCA0987198.1 aminoglycoside phosphotransferase family protein [Alkalihalobacillus algicola]